MEIESTSATLPAEASSKAGCDSTSGSIYWPLDQARESLNEALTALLQGKPDVRMAHHLTMKATEAMQAAAGHEGPDEARAAVLQLLQQSDEWTLHLNDQQPQPELAVQVLNQALDIIEPVLAGAGWD